MHFISLDRFLLLSFFVFLIPANETIAQNQQVQMIDTVVASVDGKPITLQDLSRRMTPPRNLTLAEAAADAQAQNVLNQMILEEVILAEGEAKKMQVSDSDIESYIDEIASRNHMSRPEFELALKKEGMTIDKYRKDVRFEILKSRLASIFVKGNVSVTDDEVEKFLEERVGRSDGTNQIQLRQIMIFSANKSPGEARARIGEAKEALSRGEEFSQVAARLSESPDKKDGGLLGIMAEKDLNPEIFDAIFPLKEGEVSGIIETGDGFRIFKIEKKFVSSKERDERLIAEARGHIEKQKTEEKLTSFFLTDLYKQHTVDKKI